MAHNLFGNLRAATLVCSLALLISLGLVVSGCSTKAESGAAIGALAGAAIGSQFGPSSNRAESAIIGAFLGALAGSIIGNEMDKKDQEQLSQVYESGRSNATTSWVNPDTGNQYNVTPKPAYSGKRGRPCREARIDAVVNGKPEKVVTTACRAEDGMWELQK
ncbi:MAG: RT0821/Lpp0805 family surface protein [Thermodesulfobacteriota bacterium]